MAEKIRGIAAQQQPKDLGWLRKRLTRTTFESLVTHPLTFALGVYPALRVLQSKDDPNRFASGYQPDETTLQGRMGRFTNYQAMLGLDQMKTVLPQLDRRISNAERLIGHLRDIVWFQSNDDDEVRSNYMLVTALMPKISEVCARLLELGVDTKHHYMRDCTGIGDHAGEFPNAARCENEVLHIPAYPEISPEKIDWIAERVRRAVTELGVQQTRPS
jgi:hypothetical protein